MHKLRAWFSALVLLVLVPAAAFAQASITGVVKDASGAVLPGVTVEAASPVLIEKVRSRGHRQRRAVPHRRPASRHLHADVHAAGLHHGPARGPRTDRLLHRHHPGRDEGRRRRGNDHGHRRDAGRRRPERADARRCSTRDVIAALPATRAYGSLLNAIPGLTVDNNGLADDADDDVLQLRTAAGATKAKVQINGMTVAASSGGGGVVDARLRHEQRRRRRRWWSRAAWANPRRADR